MKAGKAPGPSGIVVEMIRAAGDIAGLIKSDSPTPRATDFWGRASEKLPPARPRTSDFYGQSCPQLMSFKRVKINNWLLNTHRQVAWWHVYCVMSTSVIVN